MGSVSICGLAACMMGRMGCMVLKSLIDLSWLIPSQHGLLLNNGWSRFGTKDPQSALA